MTRIKAASRTFSQHPRLRAEILAHFPNTAFNENGVAFDKSGLIEYLDDADGAVIGLELIADEVLAACPRLRIVAKYGVGLDGIDTEACTRRGVAIGWTGGVNRRSVSEMALAFMISLSRNLYPTSIQLKGGVWHKSGGAQLSGKTVGIIGLGNIGTDLAGLLAPFGCRLLGNDIEDRTEVCRTLGITHVDKDTLFAESDVVTFHVPLTPETRHLVDRQVLEQMKPTAILINTARGPIVREADLKRALVEGTIAAAALDVFEVEPPVDHDFVSLPNLFCTPHIGGNAEEAVLAMGMSAIGHLKRHFLAT